MSTTPFQRPLLALLMFLFMTSTAHAQTTEDANGVFDPRGCEAAQTCQAPGETWEQWVERLSPERRIAKEQAEARAVAQATAGPQRRAANSRLGLVGLVTMLGGVAMMAPKGDEYHLLGDTYCVWNDYRTVDYGSCNKSAGWIQAGLVTVGAGAVMTFVGYRKVTVSPTVGHKVFGATAALKW
jgi:hypothetical protein